MRQLIVSVSRQKSGKVSTNGMLSTILTRLRSRLLRCLQSIQSIWLSFISVVYVHCDRALTFSFTVFARPGISGSSSKDGTQTFTSQSRPLVHRYGTWGCGSKQFTWNHQIAIFFQLIIKILMCSTYHTIIISIKPLDNGLSVPFPEKYIAAVWPTDNKFGFRTEEIDAFDGGTVPMAHIPMEITLRTTVDVKQVDILVVIRGQYLRSVVIVYGARNVIWQTVIVILKTTIHLS